MAILKKIRIRNFQSHRSSVLEFTPGLNVIVGPSDSGKTAVFRALKWVLFNRPLGDAFRSHKAKNLVKVDVEFTNMKVSKIRSGMQVTYEVNGTKLKAVGTDVPEPVQNAMDMSTIEIQNQFDPPFLLSNSPGEVAQFFNKVAHLDNIDRTIKTLRSLERTATTNQKSTEDAQRSTLAQKMDASILNNIEGALSRLEQAEKLKKDSYSLLQKLKEYVFAFEGIEKKCDKYKKVALILSILSKIENNKEDKKKTMTAYFTFSEKVKTFHFLEEQIQKNENAVSMLEDLKILQIQLRDIHILKTNVEEIQEQVTKFSKLREDITDIKQVILSLKKQIPNVCPTCGQVIE